MCAWHNGGCHPLARCHSFYSISLPGFHYVVKARSRTARRQKWDVVGSGGVVNRTPLCATHPKPSSETFPSMRCASSAAVVLPVQKG